MEKKKSLSLDELFGEEQSITVIWQEKEYRLKTPSSFGPGDLKKWKQLGAITADLDKIEGELTDSQAQDLENAVKGSIELLNKDLGKKALPFAARVSILEFYAEQVAGNDGEGDKKKET